MKVIRIIILAAIGTTLIELAALADPDDAVALGQIPNAAAETIEAHAAGGRLGRIWQDNSSSGKMAYRAEVIAEGEREVFKVGADGKYLRGNSAHTRRMGHLIEKEQQI